MDWEFYGFKFVRVYSIGKFFSICLYIDLLECIKKFLLVRRGILLIWMLIILCLFLISNILFVKYKIMMNF